uniref:tRNA pseudouridine(55) synthase n=1 Tax=Nicotiana tabacum TaxID=4097 RepID=A0A1S3WXN5_TOBAC|nr:PREDICTED: putative tRNA pseudouridine synthase Pus10 isoform X1 [Nicotiana tabacum]
MAGEVAAEVNGVEGNMQLCEEETLRLLRDAVNELPLNAVKDLWSIGACARCIFRLFGLHELMCSHPSLSISKWYDILADVMRKEDADTADHPQKDGEFSIKQLHQEPLKETNFCKICLGILQFLYNDDSGTLLKKDSADDFALAVSEPVKQQHHQIDSFSLEFSLPSALTENDQAVWLYMKNRYRHELWFQEKAEYQFICTKDILKLLVTNPLQSLLGVKSSQGSLRIRLTYSHSDALTRDDIQERNGGNKRRKTGKAGFTGDLKTTEESVTPHVESFDNHIGDGDGLTKVCPKDSQDLSCSYLMAQLNKVSKPCCLTIHCCRSPIFIGGRYFKYSRNVSQTRWVIDDERMGEASVEEIVGRAILPIFQGDNYKFHAAGREDIDVRMLGTGRPFLVEIQNARKVPSEVLIKEIERKINSLESQLVRVKNLRAVGSQGWDLMREGEAEKQKQYTALVWISRPVSDDDLQTISSLKELKVAQKTPIRVLHRRSPLEREKIIHWMKVERISGSSQYLLLHLCTQAGTYIKEFVHGDFGRTQPSVGSILGRRAEILQLDVTDVKMDCFQAE